MKKIMVVLIALTACIVLAIHADALMLTIDDGTNVVNVNDTDNDGMVSYNGSLGSAWFSIIAGGYSYPVYGQADAPEMHLHNASLNSTTPVSVDVTLTDTFTALDPIITGFTTNFGGFSGGTITLDTILDGSAIDTSGPFSGGAFSSTSSATALPSDPTNYMLTLHALINHTDAFEITSFNADVSPVPEPGTLILLGSGLAGLGFYRRRKNNR